MNLTVYQSIKNNFLFNQPTTFTRLMHHVGFELSPSQKRVWLLMEKECPLNTCISVRISGFLNINRLEEVFQEVVNQHESLRTNFHPQASNVFPVQVISENVNPCFECVDLTRGEQQSKEDEIKALLNKIKTYSFDFQKDFLLKAFVVKVDEMRYILALVMPSLSSDVKSLGNLVKEVLSLYSNVKDEAEEEMFQFLQYSEWHNELLRENEEEAINFWKKQTFLEHLNTKLPLERNVESQTSIKVLKHKMDNELLEKLKVLSDQCRAQFSTLLLSLWKVFIWRILDRPEELVIGFTFDGRSYEPFQKINGLLSRILPLRSTVSKSDTIKSFTHHLKENIEKNKTWQDYFNWEMFEKTDTQVFPICFEFNHVSERVFGSTEIDYKIDLIYSVSDLFKLKLCCNQFHDTVELDWYFTEAFSQESVECLKSQFVGLMERFVKTPERSVDQLFEIEKFEEDKILTQFNTSSKALFSQNVIQAFEKQAVERPNAIAIKGEIDLTYQDLNQKANQFAAVLFEKYQVTKGDLIAVFLPRSVKQIVSILGIMKAGAAYLPIDLSFPEGRLNFILEDSKAKLVIVESEQLVSACQHILTNDLNDLTDKSEANPSLQMMGSDLAYVIYTSGSSGNPKGVMIEHHSLMNYVEWFTTTYNIDEKDSTLLLSSVAFDLSYTSLWTSLASGSTLCLSKESRYFDVDAVLTALIDSQITYLKLTPSHFKMLLSAKDFKEKVARLSLRLIVLGGEAINAEDIAQFFNDRPDITFVNHYGPTETTIGTIAQTIENVGFSQFKSKPVIGKPITNNQVYILAENMALSPIGISGQIAVAGEGVARGYLNRDELTNEKFIKNPFGEASLYLTGDVARWLPDGTIEFLGRNDHQVKIRGHRIELREIENVIKTHPKIKEASVLVTGQDEKEVRAFFVVSENLSTEELKAYLGKNLPEFMIPSQMIQVDKIPLTPNGKVDRNKLLTLKNSIEKPYRGPKNSTQEQLIKIWEEVINHRPIGIRDDFFDLGGHSLKAVQIISRINKEFETKIEIKQIFENPNIEDLAKLVTGSTRKKSSEIVAIEEQQHYPVSNSQRRLWIIDQLEDQFNAYNMVSGYVLKGQIDKQAFEKAFNTIVERHESLRTVFITEKDEPRQLILKDISSFHMEFLELKKEDFHEKIDLIARDEAYKAFDLKTGPLLRAKLISDKSDHYVFLLTMHHIVSDGWSVRVFIKEFISLYNLYDKSKVNDLLPLPVQYKDYTVWHNSEIKTLSHLKQFWLNKFKGTIPVLDFPTDFERPPIKTYNGDSVQFIFNDELSGGIKEISRRHDTTVFTTLITVVKALLNRYTGQEDIVIGIPIAERTNQILENQIGLYLNNISLRTQFSADENFNDLLIEVNKGLLDAYEHQTYPFDMLIEDLNLKRDMSRSPLFDIVILKNSDYVEEEQNLKGISVSGLDSGFRVSTIDLRIVFNEGDHYITGVIDYNTDLFKRKTIVGFSENLVKVVEEILKDNTVRISDINLGLKEMAVQPELSTRFNF